MVSDELMDEALKVDAAETQREKALFASRGDAARRYGLGINWEAPDPTPVVTPVPQRPGASMSKSAPRQGKKSASPARRRSASKGTSQSPQRRSQAAADAKAQLAAEMAGIGTPPRVSPSPKPGANRRRTPPARREKNAEADAQQPLQPSPLTPVGWDVEAAKAAGSHHPSAKAQAAPPGARDASHSRDTPNKIERLRRQMLKKTFSCVKAKEEK